MSLVADPSKAELTVPPSCFLCLDSVSVAEPLFYYRIIYDLSFFVVLIVIVLNLIFGVIIDTFGDLRTEKNDKEDILKNTCFICGLERGKFDNRSTTFEDHQAEEHNLWHYLYFIVWLQIKDETEFTGPESYVAQCIKVNYVSSASLLTLHFRTVIWIGSRECKLYPSKTAAMRRTNLKSWRYVNSFDSKINPSRS
ncbi:unnamed protein product [Cylicostephanus goldi]|uniref:Ion transport domain-containing protein n=1 Tax=Cylicostephanus goldi TaxID=71465 RepID=A0A3P6QK55_CYLGO|nr:unnamed protein product [Cylicostephanus goldi]